MQKIIIDAPKKYTAVIGTHIIKNMGNYLLDCCSSSKLVIITDTDVSRIYLNGLVTDLEHLGFKLLLHIVPSSEVSKTIETAGEIISFLSKNCVNKLDLVIALGGGRVIDLVGFCTAIYAGGVDYVTIPTTLLAMVDSTVGGNVALNTQNYKNQIATTHFPKGVFCDVASLASLSKTILRDGVSEIIKLGVIADASLLELVTHIITDEDMIALVSQCINIKNRWYATRLDSIDFLGFGHTLGHAIEVHSNYSISHGQAVAIGMSMITKASERMGLTERGAFSQFSRVLTHFNFRSTYDIPLESLTRLLQYDTKQKGDSINVILLSSINKPFLHKIKLSRLSQFFNSLF